MKVCPKCDRDYADNAGFCLIDGTALVDGDAMPTVAIRSTGDDPTVVMTQPPAARPRSRVPLIVAVVVGMLILITVSVLLLSKMIKRGNQVRENQNLRKISASPTPTKIPTLTPTPRPAS